MAMSTMTLLGFIEATISRVTSFGAAAPGTSTAPTRRSARRRMAPSASRVEKMVRRPGNCAASRRSTSAERSTTNTVAPMPSAMVAACVPDTPPPSTTTSAGGTPGTPPRSTPRPPAARSR